MSGNNTQENNTGPVPREGAPGPSAEPTRTLSTADRSMTTPSSINDPVIRPPSRVRRQILRRLTSQSQTDTDTLLTKQPPDKAIESLVTVCNMLRQSRLNEDSSPSEKYYRDALVRTGYVTMLELQSRGGLPLKVRSYMRLISIVLDDESGDFWPEDWPYRSVPSFRESVEAVARERTS